MKTIASIALVAVLPALAADPALTIYNQNFAVVRDRVALDLEKGANDVAYHGATLQLEPDSVVLRDPAGKTGLRILEQSYRADVVSQGLLLSLHEGKEIEFLKLLEDGSEQLVKGRIVRSGYVPGAQGGGALNSPIIEVDGKLRFSLPGQPLFPTLGDHAILQPTLGWKLESSGKAQFDAELSYLTGGLSWKAAYNLVLPEKGATLDMVGWVTLDNQCGKTFENAAIKLMAGQVNKIQPQNRMEKMAYARAAMAMDSMEQQVTEKSFDEFHLYSLSRKVTLADKETKQVEFMRGTGVKARTLYIYDGAALPPHMRGWPEENLRNQRELGTQCNTKVAVVREFENSEANGLGLPLPAGTLRFYRRDDADGRLEFTGENTIDHTPKGEMVRIPVGDAFDLVGKRVQTDYQLDNRRRELIEKYEITLRNRKKESVDITVRETLFRGSNWEIIEKSNDFAKIDSTHVTFTIPVKPDEEKKVTYTVKYTW